MNFTRCFSWDFVAYWTQWVNKLKFPPIFLFYRGAAGAKETIFRQKKNIVIFVVSFCTQFSLQFLAWPVMDGNSRSICRICLNPKKRLLGIAETVFEALSYDKIYSECIGRSLRDFQSHPNCICKQCENEMIIAYQFRRKCLEAEEKLTAMEEEVDKPVFVEVKEELESNISDNDFVEAPRRRRVAAEDMKNPWSCEVCGRRYPNRSSMNAHRSYAHKLKPEIIPCKRCGKTFKSRTEKTGHECTRHCVQCDKMISGKHFATHEMRHRSTEKAFKCDQCSKEYHTPADLNGHKLSAHVKGESTLCVVCGKMVKQLNLKMHLRTHEPRSEAEKRSFACAECSKVYCSAASLKSHFESVHLGMKRLKVKCPHCEMRFKGHSERTAHIYKYHLKKALFSCHHCRKDFYHRNNYTNHIKVHHSFEKLFHCGVCNKAFALDSRRKLHEAYHSDERRYMCATCSKSFKLRNHLVRHMRGHTGEKSFTCPYCSNLFYSIRSVRGHVKRDHPDQQVPPPGTILSKKKLEQLAKDRELEESLLSIPVDPQLLPPSIQQKLQSELESCTNVQ
ncbi:zinc finger protein 33A-like [Phlebotomus argentipes]|uniref:zinc finger protein 33A-like n=1 Tax=Phlebotomus argentipes TaxID=94469 RepID=UPI00289357DA|nr:zinc finger protein 33A-like [Phlebotomus argentipes]